jgi:hypothetical protein
MIAINQRQRDESIARDFLTPEWHKHMKQEYEKLMAFRKTIKGKPDEYDRMLLLLNKGFIDFYETVLWHSGEAKCTCRKCSMGRQKLPDAPLDKCEVKVIASVQPVVNGPA